MSGSDTEKDYSHDERNKSRSVSSDYEGRKDKRKRKQKPKQGRKKRRGREEKKRKGQKNGAVLQREKTRDLTRTMKKGEVLPKKNAEILPKRKGEVLPRRLQNEKGEEADQIVRE